MGIQIACQNNKRLSINDIYKYRYSSHVKKLDTPVYLFDIASHSFQINLYFYTNVVFIS